MDPRGSDSERFAGWAMSAGVELMLVNEKVLGLITRDGAGNVRVLQCTAKEMVSELKMR